MSYSLMYQFFVAILLLLIFFFKNMIALTMLLTVGRITMEELHRFWVVVLVVLIVKVRPVLGNGPSLNPTE
jgi:hypothetical protein